MTDKDQEGIAAAIEGFADQGLRTIGLTYRDFATPQGDWSMEAGANFDNENVIEPKAAETDHVMLGIIGVEDPLRESVRESITFAGAPAQLAQVDCRSDGTLCVCHRSRWRLSSATERGSRCACALATILAPRRVSLGKLGSTRTESVSRGQCSASCECAARRPVHSVQLQSAWHARLSGPPMMNSGYEKLWALRPLLVVLSHSPPNCHRTGTPHTGRAEPPFRRWYYLPTLGS